MASKANFFRQYGGLSLVADYQFNNNLIDDVAGNNGAGANISYNVGSFGNEAVFNGSSSRVDIADNDAFTFTDGVNDLPFRMELIVKMNNSSTQMIINKRNPSLNAEFQVQYSLGFFRFILLSAIQGIPFIQKKLELSIIPNTYYNIILSYDGSKTTDGMQLIVNDIVANEIQVSGVYDGIINTSAQITIGRRGWGNLDFLNGAISQIKVYK